jgi:lysophospholipase L1-like esterase
MNLRCQIALLVAAAAAVLGFAFTTARSEKLAAPLKKGDRIVFLGDSITAGGAGKQGYITLIKNRVKEKNADLGIEIFGAGVSGNKVPDLQKRLEKDVLAKKPTIVFIYIGINDVWHGENNPPQRTSSRTDSRRLSARFKPAAPALSSALQASSVRKA